MATKISVYIAASLDGFIARKNGDIDWLTAVEAAGEDYGYREFISSIDLLVMGRHTYEKVLTFETWPYPDKKVIVLSSGNPPVPKELEGKVEVANQSPRDLLKTLENSGSHTVYLDGGQTIQRFLREGLVDEMTITIIPILLGEGISLFGPLHHDMKLSLMESNYFKNGLVQCKYRVEK
jgi:dihydrofolate reductase